VFVSLLQAIIKVTDDICKLTRKDHGLVASQDGLALGYPVIAAREKGGALLAFSFSGKGTIAGGQHPAYPGVYCCPFAGKYDVAGVAVSSLVGCCLSLTMSAALRVATTRRARLHACMPFNSRKNKLHRHRVCLLVLAGVASAIVGHRQGANSDKTIIHIIKKGTVALDPWPNAKGTDSIPWGIGSAAQVCGDQMWFSVNMPATREESRVDNEHGADVWYGSWITWQQL
jgi:hypothetical protein